MYVIGIFLVCLAAVSVTSCEEIHKRMTAEEVQEVFNTNHDSVPDYEVVQVHVSKVQKRDLRSRRSIRIKAFDGDINLWLEPTDGILAGEDTPVLLATVGNANNPVKFKNLPNAMRKVGQLLQNRDTRTSLVVSQNSNNRYAINGYVGSRNLVVRSLPETLSNELIAKSNSSVESTEDLHYHVLFKADEKFVDPGYQILPLNETLFQSKLTRKRRAIPNIIYPELMIHVDYGTYTLHGSNVLKVLKYLLAFWNNVDLKYRSLESPKVRLNIARVIIASDPSVSPHITDNMVNSETVNAVDALNTAATFFYSKQRRIPLDSYDAVILMTTYGLTTMGTDDPIGYAIVGGACNVDDASKKIYKTGIIQDNGSFDTWAASHELAHLLGSHHDGSVCPSSDGYIMSPGAMSTDHSWDFSPCSLKDFQDFLDKDPTCLYNVPRTAGRLLPRLVPGKILSYDEQCRLSEGTGACKLKVLKAHEECLYLSCDHKTLRNMCSLQYGHGPADGTPCGNQNQFCFRGKCTGPI